MDSRCRAICDSTYEQKHYSVKRANSSNTIHFYRARTDIRIGDRRLGAVERGEGERGRREGPGSGEGAKNKEGEGRFGEGDVGRVVRYTHN